MRPPASRRSQLPVVAGGASPSPTIREDSGVMSILYIHSSARLRSFSSTSRRIARGRGRRTRTNRLLSMARLRSIMTSHSCRFPAIPRGSETRRTDRDPSREGAGVVPPDAERALCHRKPGIPARRTLLRNETNTPASSGQHCLPRGRRFPGRLGAGHGDAAAFDGRAVGPRLDGGEARDAPAGAGRRGASGR